jgi:hypothetical protein
MLATHFNAYLRRGRLVGFVHVCVQSERSTPITPR